MERSFLVCIRILSTYKRRTSQSLSCVRCCRCFCLCVKCVCVFSCSSMFLFTDFNARCVFSLCLDPRSDPPTRACWYSFGLSFPRPGRSFRAGVARKERRLPGRGRPDGQLMGRVGRARALQAAHRGPRVRPRQRAGSGDENRRTRVRRRVVSRSHTACILVWFIIIERETPRLPRGFGGRVDTPHDDRMRCKYHLKYECVPHLTAGRGP